MSDSAVRAVRIVLPNLNEGWTVVGPDGLSIDEVDVYLQQYLTAVNSSPNTIASYARHLALFFRWLHSHGQPWEQIDFQDLTHFARDLRDGTLLSIRRPGVPRESKPRSRATCQAVMAAVYSFLEYWRLEGRGPDDLRIDRSRSTTIRTTMSFLAHVESKRSATERRLKFRGATTPPPKIINFEEDFATLLLATRSVRDSLLLSAMYDGGLRISQALGLMHGDLDFGTKSISIVRRTDNPNRALSKQRSTFVLNMPPRFFDLYSRYLVDEQLALGIDSDYVFTNLQPQHRGAAMSYSNAQQVVRRVSRRAGITMTAHTLRHTHGTQLAKEGWTAPEIAKRLGQSHNSSADVYIHLAEDDIEARWAESEVSKR